MGGLSRRELLERAAVGGLAAGVAGPIGSAWARSIPRRQAGKTVAVLGGGIAGLTAAHELAERGFSVDVYERHDLGGKARSIPVAGTAAGGRRALPGEHGFRFFPGFYHHVPDTMRRIPCEGNANGVWDNLVDTTEMKVERSGGRPDAQLFGLAPDPAAVLTVDGLRAFINEELLAQRGVPPQETAYFTERLLVFLTSCDERRYGEWEHTSWWDFVGAESRSQEYQHVIAQGMTRTLVAAKEKVASTRTIGNMGEAIVMNAMGRGNDGAVDRVLDRPTNEAWIDPWVKLLRSLGVRFHTRQLVNGLEVHGGRVAAATATGADGRRRPIEADWFVSAMPAERARKLWSRDVLAADPALGSMNELLVDWMNGIQFYLRRPLGLIHGHITFADAPWALTALTQGQFWTERDFQRDYGDGSVVDCLSIDISDWDTPGILYDKPAKLCRREQVAREVWAQISEHLNDEGEEVLTKDNIHSWHLDPAIQWSAAHRANRNAERLLVNTVGSWENRPQASTAIPNLFLAGDYVQTDVDLATMEGANEAAREAVNRLLDAAGSKAAPAAKYALYDPPEMEGEKAVDAELCRAGRPNLLDVG
jgi:uncharacterized protein with NAD-binding domain and iron-sulfur cluster